MFKTIDRYLAVLVIGFKQQLAYKKDYFLTLGFRIFASFIMVAVWTAVYLNSDVTSIGGFTLPQMYLYFFLINAIAISSFNEPISENIQDDIQSGTVTTALVKPVAYTAQIFLNSLGNNIFAGLAVTLPFLALIVLIGHLALSIQAIAFFLIEMALSFTVSTFIFFMIGTLAVYLTNIWGIIAVTESLYMLLGGGVVPLSLLPSWANNILALLPMQLSLYLPAATLLGMASTGEILQSILVGLVWAVPLFALSVLVWNRVRGKITSVGG
ncbi:MAG: ABC-2 family transporter protein [Candidatus Marsarchaeota archaeon]|nr:ABC-2 family transporter protein [Candidatus Marsarchaeota archaeon]